MSMIVNYYDCLDGYGSDGNNSDDLDDLDDLDDGSDIGIVDGLRNEPSFTSSSTFSSTFSSTSSITSSNVPNQTKRPNSEFLNSKSGNIGERRPVRKRRPYGSGYGFGHRQGSGFGSGSGHGSEHGSGSGHGSGHKHRHEPEHVQQTSCSYNWKERKSQKYGVIYNEMDNLPSSLDEAVKLRQNLTLKQILVLMNLHATPGNAVNVIHDKVQERVYKTRVRIFHDGREFLVSMYYHDDLKKIESLIESMFEPY